MSYSGFNMMGVVDDKEMQKSLRELAILQKKDVNEITRQWAGTLGRYLAVWTKPFTGNFELGKQSRMVMEGNVTKGIGYVYKDIRTLFAKIKGKNALLDNGGKVKAAPIIRRLMTEGRHEDAENVLQNIPGFKEYKMMMFDGGKIHRGSRGVKSKIQHNVIVDSLKLREYINKKRKMVGFTKAAWINAATQVTGKTPSRVGRWISKHTTSPGFGSFSVQGPIGKATLSSRLPWASDTLNESTAFREFSQNFTAAIGKAIDYHLKKEQRKK